MRDLRFGLQSFADRWQPADEATRAEELGYDVFLVADHVGPHGPSPLAALAHAARATTQIGLGTFVLNNDMRNPVQAAWESVTIDRLSGGRMELGLGAGHTPQEYAATGLRLDPPKVRKHRLMESVEIIRRLFDGEEVDHRGEHYELDGARVPDPVQDRPPILVGGNGRALLEHAGAHADIIGLQGLGRTLEDGHSHDVRWDPGWLTEQVAQVARGAGPRFEDLELNALVQVVEVTDDIGGALDRLSTELDLDPDHLEAIPYVLVGTVDEIAAKIERCRDRWGITYFVVREMEAFAPVIAALRS